MHSCGVYMLSFSQFVLSEAGDKPYDFHVGDHSSYNHDFSSQYHPHSSTYEFQTGGSQYHAAVLHDSDQKAYVVFGTNRSDEKSPYEVLGDKGSKATKILSTIHHIVKDHVERHPKLKTVAFTSDEMVPSRVKLYTQYTKKMGGKTEDHELVSDIKVHTIPASSYKGE